MIIKFEEWLTNQQYRKDRIGDFARVLSTAESPRKIPRHKWDEHKGWADIVTRITNPEYIVTFNLAWREFIQANEIVIEDLD